MNASYILIKSLAFYEILSSAPSSNGDARKVLCVALDYAKRKHVALICDGHGDVLKASFPVENNAAGIAHLIKEVTATARRRKIPKNHKIIRDRNHIKYSCPGNLLGEIKSWVSTANSTSFSQANNGDTKRNNQTYLFV